MKMERIWVGWLIWAAMVAAELQGSSGCLEKERTGLMKLWKAIKPNDSTPLPIDCCSWIGVHCSAATGRVESLTFFSDDEISLESPGYFLNTSLLLPFEELLELNLSRCRIDGLINQAGLAKLSRLQKLIISETFYLTKLPRLQKLRMSVSENILENVVSLQAFANMKNLKYLDLSYTQMNISNLEGMCDMKNIIKLHLSRNSIRGHLPLCIGNLTRLQILDISDNQIEGSIPWTIGNLSHLSSLYLQENYLSGVFSLHTLANNSKLENLYLSSHHHTMQLETETQSWVPSFQLLRLNLSNSNLNKMSDSVTPTFFLHQSQLMLIDLSYNNLQGTFPSWLLQNNSNLHFLLMRNNFLTENFVLPNFIHGLRYLVIYNNKMDGKLPDNLQVFLPALEVLFIAKNRFEGNLPSSFGALERLRIVDLSFNSFTGELSKTLFGNNTDLFYIDFSNNLLRGEISLNLTALPSLKLLVLSNNKFNGSLEELTSRSLSPLQVLDVSNNLISGIWPNSNADFSFLTVLRISNNSFKGGIPDKLCHIKELHYLDISHNNFSGSIPSCLGTSSISFLFMRNCSLFGVIPNGLSINSTLIALDLSYNDFSLGVLPNWIYSQQKLQILLMAGLRLEGEISTHLCGLKNIKIMDLSHNNFNGSIPSCLFKMSSWVAKTLFFYSNGTLEVEFTAKGILNRFQNQMLYYMTGLDVSSNRLSGQIPPQIGDSEEIRALNLSNNRLWGSIPSNISRLRSIESLDLSSNNLSGEIPSEIVRLNFISYFNVSNNNLSGPTPNGGQFSNFDEQNYGGNKFLCGPLLHRVCTISSPSTPPDEQDNDETASDDDERISFWWSFGASYVTVIISLFVLLGINTHFSRVWFHTVDVFCSKLFCVFVKMKFLLPKKK